MGNDALRAAQPPTLPEAADTHYTLHEAAEEIRVDIGELQRAIKANSLTCSHRYGRHMVSRSDLETYRLQTQPATSEPE